MELEIITAPKPTSFNPPGLAQEIASVGFGSRIIELNSVEIGIEVYVSLSDAQRNQILSIVAAHTGSKTSNQLAAESEAEKQQIKDTILEGLANPPAAGKMWITDPAIPEKGVLTDPPPGTPGPKGDQGAPGPPGGTSFIAPLVVEPTVALTNAPAGGVEVPNQHSRAVLDLRNAVNCIVQALFSVIPASGGTCRVEYSVNAGSTWAALADSGTTAHVANVLKVGTSTPIPTVAKTASTYLRVMVTGNAVADPVLQKAIVTFVGG